MKKYFVTGSEGFIGSSLVEKLLEKKSVVFALVNYNSFGNIGWLRKLSLKNKRLKVIFGDLKDPETYLNYLGKSDYVINLASLISVPYSYSAPKSYLENNILGCHFLPFSFYTPPVIRSTILCTNCTCGPSLVP